MFHKSLNTGLCNTAGHQRKSYDKLKRTVLAKHAGPLNALIPHKQGNDLQIPTLRIRGSSYPRTLAFTASPRSRDSAVLLSQGVRSRDHRAFPAPPAADTPADNLVPVEALRSADVKNACKLWITYGGNETNKSKMLDSNNCAYTGGHYRRSVGGGVL